MATADVDDAELQLVGLTKRFGSFTAVDAIDLTVPAGAFIALLGPSGCGKTTTLRMVAGLEEPTAGQILLGGADLTRLKPYKRPVNTVFQNYALFPHLDIAENVAFGLRRSGERNPKAKVGEMLEMVQLSGYERRKPSEISGGQAQRVALARALINHPKMLLLDEPLGALDLKLRREMQLTLKHLQTEVGITFLHVTHDQEEAMTMADTIAVMNAGAIEQRGSPTTLYEQPATAFVANFLGQSNLLQGRVVDHDGALAVVAVGDLRVAVPADRVQGRDGPVAVGVRPEKLVLAPTAGDGGAGDSAAPNVLPGVVSDASFMGVSTQYLVRTAWGQELTVFTQNRDTTLLAPGTEVRLTWQPEHTFVVPADEAAAAVEPERAPVS